MSIKLFLLASAALVVFASPCAVLSAGAPPASLGLPRGCPVDTADFLGSGGKSASHIVRASLVWRDDALEIRLRRLLSEGEVPKAIGTHDRPVTMFGSGADTLEVFLAPHVDDPGIFYQFAVNPSNVFYQARGMDMSWRPLKPVTVRTYVASTEWGADFRIPFGAFGEAPVSDGTVWRANFSGCRTNWSALSFYHNPFDFGTIVFGGRFARIDPKPCADTPKDATLLELDCFYYPEGTNIVDAVRKQFPAAEVTVSQLSSSEFAVRVECSGKASVGQVEIIPADIEWPDGAHYMIRGSVDTGSRFKVHSLFRSMGFVEKPARGYVFDSSIPYFGATNVLSHYPPGPLSLNRLAYEAQLAVMTRAGKDAPIFVEPSPAAFYQARYRELKAMYPNHIFSIHIDANPFITDFSKACDVFDVTVPGASYAADPLPRIRGAFDYIRYYVGDKPVVFWLGGSLPEKAAHRTADELNTAVRYSILRGAFGNMIHLGHGGVPECRTRLWDFLRRAEQATNRWYPDWARGIPVDLSVTADDPIAAAARHAGGQVLLLAVNLSAEERAMSYSDPATGARETIRLPGYGSVLRRICASRR